MAKNSAVGSGVEFISSESVLSVDFVEYLKELNFFDFGLSYNVTTILGCQSSGKSSLLNQLYGLDFAVMDTKAGHSQTTRGMWAALLPPENPSEVAQLIIDVEGTDSRERGEGRLTFEHRSALMALALSDVVLLNLWYHSLGTFAGSNYGLIKTVIEANLEIQGDDANALEPKTLLVFCIRDWFPELAPLDVIKRKIFDEYMGPIWEQISKPAHHSDLKLEALFEIKVVGLAHALVNPEEFKRNVESLAQELKQAAPKKYSRNIPADGFCHYAANVWKTILNQEHLDIPNQREMLAAFRCAEISASVLAKVDARKNEGLHVVDFSFWANGVVKEALVDYWSQASRYDAAVCNSVANKTLQDASLALHPIFEHHMNQYAEELLQKFKRGVNEEFPIVGAATSGTLAIGSKEPHVAWPNFSSVCNNLLEQQKQALEIKAIEFTLQIKLDGLEQDLIQTFDSKASINTFVNALEREVEHYKLQHLQLLRQCIETIANEAFCACEAVLSDASVDPSSYWESIDKAIESSRALALERFEDSYKGLIGSAKEHEFDFLCLVWLTGAIGNRLVQVEANVTKYILARFESNFNYTILRGETIPRDWSRCSAEELDTLYAESKKKALCIVAVLMSAQVPKIEPPKFDVSQLPENHILYSEFTEAATIGKQHTSNVLNENAQVAIKEECKGKFHALYQNAKAIQSSNKTLGWRNIPAAFWLLLLLCGWNELWMLLRLIIKVQILIPLLVLLLFLLHGCANSLFGERAKTIVEPVWTKVLAGGSRAASWGFKHAMTVALKSRSGKTSTSNTASPNRLKTNEAD